MYTYPSDTHLGYAPEWSNVVCTTYPPYGSGAKKRDEGGIPAGAEERDGLAEQAVMPASVPKTHMRWDRRHKNHAHAHRLDVGRSSI